MNRPKDVQALVELSRGLRAAGISHCEWHRDGSIAVLTVGPEPIQPTDPDAPRKDDRVDPVARNERLKFGAVSMLRRKADR